MIKDFISHAGKRELRGEIIVTLFEFCDMSCKFCNQDHNSIEGINTIRTKLPIIQQAIDKLKKSGRTHFSVHIMGGEVFSDKIPDYCFDDYKYLYDNLISDNVEVCFTTNFVWKETERVKQLLNDCPNLTLLTSYDPSGRFSEKNFNTFMINLYEFKDKVKSINVIMTRPNIKKFLAGDEQFDSLYKDFDFFFDYYTPEKNIKIMSPSDVELRDLMIYMIKNYPKVIPFNSYLKEDNQRMSCQDTYTIMPSGDGGFCTILLDENISITKNEMETTWFKDYNCLECKYFQRCTLGCFLSNHLSSFRTQDICFLSEVYNYVEGSDTKSS